ncbi:hypothetical protein CYY_005662 [Polysphondylium violaceum]|uniref:NADH dehydrogenase [ubiquinone] 1 beta subcomplex subunit 9 n=1 Tax=Polysphondylium violaceum TaxID=133409 RepID=A0A8J4Q2M2_9MYCE|nr:hypothetical protein CYY_005662 [Polysphondylium violaceum]
MSNQVLTHSQRVVRLYRKSLKNIRDYSEDYDMFLKNAQDLRSTIKERANETDQFLIKKYVKELEKFENFYQHPDPYTPCDAVNGSKWQRNIPPPLWAVNPYNHVLDK